MRIRSMKNTRDRVVYIDKEHLKKFNIIQDVFDYLDLELDSETKAVYEYFEKKFIEHYKLSADVFNINEHNFYMRDSYQCNAFAASIKGYNIIGITNSYPILMSKKFDSKYFESIVFNFLINKESIGLAYVDLCKTDKFDFGKFMMDCSINFTFGHEFRHIKQFNSAKIRKESYYLQENMMLSDFDMRKHAWEFDADISGSYDVLKYVLNVERDLVNRSNEKLMCLLYAGCASMLITKYLFYYGFIYQNPSNYNVKKVEFYTKKYSHPHPLVRCMNILSRYYDNIVNDFPKLEMEYQEYFNNVFGIIKLYFDSLLGSKNFITEVFDDLKTHIDVINEYNNELYSVAVQDEAIRNLLIASNTEFED